MGKIYDRNSNFSINGFEGINIVMNQVHRLHIWTVDQIFIVKQMNQSTQLINNIYKVFTLLMFNDNIS